MIRQKDGKNTWRTAADYDLGKRYKFKVSQLLRQFCPDLTRYLLQIARSTLAREASTSKDPARHLVRGVRLLEDLGGEQGGDTVTVCA